MGFAHRALVAAGAGFAAAVIVGCGSSGGSWLSASQSSRLNAQLNNVQQALESHNCAQAQQYLADFQSTVDGMGGVNSTLIGNLDQGVSTIQSLATSECRTVTTTPKKTHPRTTTNTTPTQTTQTFTNPATQTQTYSTPTYTQPTDTTPNTSTSGGTCPTCFPTVTTTSTTSTDTTPSGGGGLGGSDSSTTGASTTGATSTTGASATTGSAGSGGGF